MPFIRQFFKAYVTDGGLRDIIEARQFSRLADNPKVSLADVKALGDWSNVIPEYVKDSVDPSLLLPDCQVRQKGGGLGSPPRAFWIY